jgi:dTDP-4-amino-4,6-dideoxygalactose transaminase
MLERVASAGNLRPLWPSLPAGVCPLAFPLRVEARNETVAALQREGIAALPWWAGFHLRSLDWLRYPEACALKRQMLVLPIHQNLDEQHLTYMVERTAAAVSRPHGVS